MGGATRLGRNRSGAARRATVPAAAIALWCAAAAVLVPRQTPTAAPLANAPSGRWSAVSAQEAPAPGAYLPLSLRSSAGVPPPPPRTAGPVAPSQTSAPPTPSPTAVPTVECGSVPTFADGLVPERELHVAADGDDGSGDGSPSRPFATIGRAARAAGPGTAIRVRSGTYRGGVYVDGLRGEPERPVWIGGAPGEAPPVLEGAGEGLHLVRPAYVVLERIEVRGSASNGVNVDDGGDVADETAAHHVVVREVAIHDVGGTGNQDCLKLSGLRDFVVLDSAFGRCGGGGSGSGVDMVGAHRGVIARNRFEALSANAVQAKGGSTDIEVRWNHMRDAGHRAVNMGGSTGFAYFRPPLDRGAPNAEARDIRVLANVIEGSDTPLAFVGCVGCVAANNTIVDPSRWLMRILQETTSRDGYEFEPTRDGTVANNLFVFRRDRLAATINIGPGTAPETFAFAHDLWFARDDPSRSAPDLPVAEVGAVIGQDPRLRPDHTIAPDSPAAGRGRSPAPVAGDAGGACYGDPPSIGAFEARP